MATRQQMQQHLPPAIEPISEFLFVSCLLDSTEENKITQALTDGTLFADVRIMPQMTILSPGKSVIEHLQRSRRIKMALIDALADKMQTLGPEDDFQQLFYERVRHNKQLSMLENSILTSDSFRKSLREVGLFLQEQQLETGNRGSGNVLVEDVDNIEKDLMMSADDNSFASFALDGLGSSDSVESVPVKQPLKRAMTVSAQQYVQNRSSLSQVMASRISIRLRNVHAINQEFAEQIS